MTSQPAVPVYQSAPVRRSAPPLLLLTRLLAALHALAGLGALGLAAHSFLSYRDAPADETFAGLWIIVGAGYVVLGLGLVVLGIGATLARGRVATYGVGLATGVFALVGSGPGSLLLPYSALASLVTALPLVLLTCAVVGLATAKSNRA
ncbi:MAG: hypothetical protein OSB43_07775 [Nocardioides sp.]|uniref:hypothetical protein n=1 Tax=Nocardioides sp. TaxID=35761 RepID=UPI002395143E|nr:hypothetical protein [Nocardioides sp.]MDE0776155.1 hypothetical protein [Nocardioides sp.]